MPAESTLPIITSSIVAGSTPARATASRTAIAPSSTAGSHDSDPRNLPIGVRQAERMNALGIGCLFTQNSERPSGIVDASRFHAIRLAAAPFTAEILSNSSGFLPIDSGPLNQTSGWERRVAHFCVEI